MWLKQSTAAVVSFGPFLDRTDGVTLETGLVSAIDHATTGAMLSKNGGALTIRSQAVTASTYDARGCYRVTLSTTDTNTLGTLRAIFEEAATALPVWQDFMVVPANVWDSLYGADLLDVNTQEWNDLATVALPATPTNITAGTVTTATNVTNISTGGIAAASFAAGAIDAAAIAANAIGAAELAADVITDVWQGTALTEAYAADGIEATPAQLLYMIWSAINEFAISGATLTCKKLDGSTTSMTFTLSDVTNPTSRTRAT